MRAATAPRMRLIKAIAGFIQPTMPRLVAAANSPPAGVKAPYQAWKAAADDPEIRVSVQSEDWRDGWHQQRLLEVRIPKKAA